MHHCPASDPRIRNEGFSHSSFLRGALTRASKKRKGGEPLYWPLDSGWFSRHSWADGVRYSTSSKTFWTRVHTLCDSAEKLQSDRREVVSRENRSLWQLLSLAKTAEVSRPPAADAGMRKNKENAHSSQEFKLRGRADPSSPFASSIWTKEKHTYDDAYTVMATETKFSFHQERHFVRDPKDCIPRSAPPRSISTRLARCSFPRLRAVHGA